MGQNLFAERFKEAMNKQGMKLIKKDLEYYIIIIQTIKLFI